jgi:hypothetical protein
VVDIRGIIGRRENEKYLRVSSRGRNALRWIDCRNMGFFLDKKGYPGSIEETTNCFLQA